VREIVAFKLLLISILLSTFSSVYASDFLFALVHKSNFGLIKENTSLIVFKNGKYIFESNTGTFGLCNQKASTGRFKGQFNKQFLKTIVNELTGFSKACSKLKGCVKGRRDRGLSSYWTVRDYTKKNVEYEVIGNYLPKLISLILDNEPMLRNSPISSLALVKYGDSFALKYKSSSELKVRISLDNFYIIETSGALVSVKKYLKNSFHFKEKNIKLSSKKNVVSFNLPINIKKYKGKLGYLLFSTATDAHHLDNNLRDFSPCLKF
jgi:hypothetical protein